MAGSLQPRVKTWVSLEDVEYDDLNAEFDNCLTAMQPLLIDDYSANTSQMQVTTDPGEVGTESLATTLAGELARIRFLIKEITGESQWYTSPSSSLAGLENVVGTGLTDNRLVSGRVRATSAQPVFLVPNGAARTIKLDGTPTNFLYYVDGTQYTISTDITLTNLTAAPSSNNTCLVDDAILNDQYWTKYLGEDGTEITVDNMESGISNLTGEFAAFKISNGVDTEYFTAYVKSTTALSKVRRGYFFDSSDAPIPRIAFANNDTITLMKLTWVFAKTDGTLTVTYNNPVWSDDEPSSPDPGDYWFDLSANTWKKYDVAAYIAADAILVGICIQDTSNTVAARSFEFFDDYQELNTIELFAESNTQVKSRFPGGQVSVWGTTVKNDYNLHTWDMTLDLESGVTEAASTYYYFYITETGDKVISDKKPHDRREDLKGYYHPSHSWRCVGWAFNNSSSHLEQVESYYKSRESATIRSVIAADYVLTRDRINILSGASATSYLPPAASCRGESYKFRHGGTSLSQIYTIEGFLSETIEGATSVKMHTNGQFLELTSDGSGWIITASKTSTAWTAVSDPAIGAITSAPTKATTKIVNQLLWRRNGTNLEGRWEYAHAASAGAANGTGDYLFTIVPSGATIDTTKVTVYTTAEGTGFWVTYSSVGICTAASGTTVVGSGPVTVYDTTQARFFMTGAANTGTVVIGPVGSGNYEMVAADKMYVASYSVPITDWLP